MYSRDPETKIVRTLLPPRSEKAYVHEVLPHLNPDTLRNNIDTLRRVLEAVRQNPDRVIDYPGLNSNLELLEHIISYFDKHPHSIDDVLTAKNVFDHLQQCGYSLVEPTEEADFTLNGTIAYLVNMLQEATGNLVFTSSTHEAGYPEIHALYTEVRKINPEAKIGLLILDTHADVYTSTSIHKGSFLAELFRDGCLHAAGILGLANDFKEALVKGEGVFGKRSPHYRSHFLFRELAGRLAISSDSDNYTNEKFDRTKFTQNIHAMLQMFKQQGVTHVVIQLDTDVLRLLKIGYTVQDYNPINYLYNLAMQDLTTVPKFMLISALTAPLGLDNKLGLDGKYLSRLRFGENPLSSLGLPLSAVGQVLRQVAAEAKEMEMSFGIDLPGGGHHVLSVTEMTGPDAGGRMTRALHALIAVLEEVRNQAK